MSSALFEQGAMSMAMPSSTSPGHSSPEAFEVEEDPNVMSSAHWQQGQGHTSPSSASQARAPAPLQKRRRVTRACDECRRKKIKCDGKQPCTHCTVYSYGMLAIDFIRSSEVCFVTHSISLIPRQTARTTSLPTEEGTPHHNTLKP